MKKFILLMTLIYLNLFMNAQPCKLIKQGMTKSEVVKLVGEPKEIDPIGADYSAIGSRDRQILMTAWQYDISLSHENDISAQHSTQRIEFMGDTVSNVIADGDKYDEIITSFSKGEISGKELNARIEKMNREVCK